MEIQRHSIERLFLLKGVIIIALSGSIQKVFKTGYTLKTEWSATQNISGNYSTVTCTHKLILASAYSLYIGSRSNSCIVGGVSKSFSSAAISTGGGTTITLGTTTHQVNHNSDGTASVSINTTFNVKATISGGYLASVTASGTINLNTIPRTSSVTCNSFNIGDSTTITINRASSSFSHTVKYTFGNATGTIATQTTATSVGWTPTASTLYGQIPNNTSGTGTITCETYNGSTLIGTSTTNFTAYAKKSDCLPAVSATIADTNSGTSGASGNSSIIVRYISKPKVTISATAKNSATIKTYRIAWGDGQTSTASSATFSSGVSSPTVTVTATDSRGYSTSTTYNLSSLGRWKEYIYPTVTKFTAERTESTSSTANLRAVANYYNGSFGSSSNSYTFSYRYRKSNGTWGSWTNLASTTSGNTATGTATISGISTENSYDFQVKISDYFNTSETVNRNISKSIGILRVADDYVRVNGDIQDKFRTRINGGLATYYEGSSINPNETLEELILTNTNTPTSAYWYVRTMFFKDKTLVARRTQIAFPYSYDSKWVDNRIFVRVFVENSGWTWWKDITTESITKGYLSSVNFNDLYTELGIKTYYTDPYSNTYTNAPPGAYMYGTLIVITNDTNSAQYWRNSQIYIPDQSKAMWFRASSGAWRKIVSENNLQAGGVNITPVANQPTYVTVTFPTAFSTIPRVIVSAKSSGIGTTVLGVSSHNVSTTGFNLYITRKDATTTGVDWVAYEP